MGNLQLQVVCGVLLLTTLAISLVIAGGIVTAQAQDANASSILQSLAIVETIAGGGLYLLFRRKLSAETPQQQRFTFIVLPFIIWDSAAVLALVSVVMGGNQQFALGICIVATVLMGCCFPRST